MKRLAPAALGLVLLVAPAGCGGGLGTVTGTVTFDDKPVAEGAIIFMSAEGEPRREGAVIKDGAFTVPTRLPPGKYRIQLNAKKVVEKRKQKGFDGKDEEVEITEELFPERFNSKTELSEEIRPGPNTVKLDLKSKK
jgi:hypothetical protein